MKKLWAYVKAMGVGVVNHPQQVIDVAMFCLVVLVLYCGHRVSWLEAADTRGGVVIGIVALSVGTRVIPYLYAKRCATQLEASLRREGRPGRLDQADLQENKDALRIKFRKGIDALKQSQLAKGVRGSTALYRLPWVMIIGPSGAGKTKAIEKSGLEFPRSEGKELGEIKGTNGTRNCDWWFTNHGIVLDTAGRYMNEVEEDREEWEEFLQLLRKYRARKPINGVIVAIPSTDLTEGSDESIEKQATNIRTRIDQLIKRLGVVFPVYVVVTKCDLVGGFEEFFHDLGENERKQVWGCTFPTSGDGSEAVVARVRSGMKELGSVVNERRLVRLSQARGSGKVPIFSFPMELAVVQDRLAGFVGTLFQENVYQKDRPWFRGVYFTTGTQEGMPSSQVLKSVVQESGLSEKIISARSEPVHKSYFLKDLFLKVIFPDQDLVTPSSAWNTRLQRIRIAMIVAMFIAVPLAVTGLLASFAENERALHNTKTAASQLQHFAQDSMQFPTHVKLLGALSSQLSEIDLFTQKGVPLWISLFYQGDKLRRTLRDVYFEGFDRVLLAETIRDMEQQLQRLTNMSDDDILEKGVFKEQYDLLKVYRMLVEPAYFKKDVVKTWLNTHWNRRLDVEGKADLKHQVSKEIEFYTEYIASDRPMYQDARINRFMSAAQEQLRKIPLRERLYALSRADAEQSVHPFQVGPDIVGSVFSQKERSEHEESVVGICTVDGWKGPFQKSVAKVLTEMADEVWVLGEAKMDSSKLKTEIKRLHGRECVQQWQAFLKSLHVRLKTAVTSKELEQELKTLAAADSPIQRILDAVVHHTVGDSDASLIGQADGGKAVIMPPNESRSPDEFPTAMSNLFRGLPQLIAAPKDGVAPFTTYLATMGKVHQAVDSALSRPEDTLLLAGYVVNGESNAILDAMKQTEEMLSNPNLGAWSSAIAPFLKEPWIVTAKAVMRRATDEVQGRWTKEVYAVCRDKVEGRYPFYAGGRGEVSMQDVSDLFRPKSGDLWRFYDDVLQKFVTERVDGWDVKRWKNAGLDLSREFLTSLKDARLLRDSLFRVGSRDPNVPHVDFAVQPGEYRYAGADLSEIHLEVGGQTSHYRNDKPKWVQMEWPGPRLSGGAALWLVIDGMPEYPKEFQFPGEWGLIHLIDADRSKAKKDASSYDVKWDVPLQNGRRVQVPYTFKTKTPFHPDMFRQVRCVERLSEIR